jgi:hypothetical protein
MKILTALGVTLSTAIFACSSQESPGAGESDVNPDRVIVDAPSTTREEIGVSSWGIGYDMGATVVRGYDESKSAIVVFAYRGARGNVFTAKLDAGETHATMRVEASDATHLRVVDDSFKGSSAAKTVLARLVADLESEPVRGTEATLSTASIRPLDLVGGGAPTDLVSQCNANLVPSSANAGQAVGDCGADPNSPGCQAGVGGAGPQCCGATSTADRYLGRNTSELKGSGDLPMDPGVSSSESCANFVSAVLQSSGLINWHSNKVSDLENRLRAEGWTQTSNPKPGDVAIIDGGSHAELVDSNDGGVMLVGSNNANADGSQRITRQAPYSKNVIYLTPPANRCQ